MEVAPESTNIYFNLPKKGMKTLNRIKRLIYDSENNEDKKHLLVEDVKHYISLQTDKIDSR